MQGLKAILLRTLLRLIAHNPHMLFLLIRRVSRQCIWRLFSPFYHSILHFRRFLTESQVRVIRKQVRLLVSLLACRRSFDT